MAARLTSEQGVTLLQGLWELVSEEGEAGLKFNFLTSSREVLTDKFKSIWTSCSPTFKDMGAVLGTFTDGLPRFNTADKVTIARLLDPPDEPPEGEIAPKIKAMSRHQQVDDSPDHHLETVKSFFQGLRLTADYCVKKYGDASSLVNSFAQLAINLDDLHERRVTAAIMQTDQSSLEVAAKALLAEKRRFTTGLKTYGEVELEDYFDEGVIQQYAAILGLQESGFAWQQLKQAVSSKSYLQACQVFENVNFNAEAAFKTTFDGILKEVTCINETSTSQADSATEHKNKYINESVDALLEAIGEDSEAQLELLDAVELQDKVDRTSDLIKEIKKMRLDGIEVDLSQQKLDSLSSLKLESQRKLLQVRKQEKKDIKDAEFVRQEEARAVPAGKLPPLIGIRSWLPFLAAYKQLTNSSINETKKLNLIMNALNKDDRAACTDQPLPAVQQYLMQKYHDTSLIVQTLMTDALGMSKPRSDAEMEANLLSVLKTFDICSHHGILSHFDSTFADSILVLLFTDRELHKFLEKKAADARPLSSSRLSLNGGAAGGGAAGVDVLHASSIAGDEAETAEEKRDYLIKYCRVKLDSLRSIASQKKLLHQRTGDKPKKTWEKKSELRCDEVKKTDRKESKKKSRFPPPRGQPAGQPPDKAAAATPRHTATKDDTPATQQFRCLAGCVVAHQTKRGFLSQSLALCPKFLALTVQEQDKLVSQIPKFCKICVAPKSSHRGHTGVCWITSKCRYCGDPTHNGILCREKSREEKKEIDRTQSWHKKIIVEDKIEKHDWRVTGCPGGADAKQQAMPGTPPPAQSSPVNVNTQVTVNKKVIQEFVDKENMTEAHRNWGFELFESPRNTQGATGNLTLAAGGTLRAQFDNQAQSSFVLDRTARELNLPVISRQQSRIKTLNGTKNITTRTYKLEILNNDNEVKVIKATGLPSLGGNPRLDKNVRIKLAQFFKIELSDLEDTDGPVHVLIGQRHQGISTRTLPYTPPANAEDITVVSSPVIKKLMFCGGVGVDQSVYQDVSVKNTEFDKFIAAENDIRIDSARCDACAKCSKCKYENRQVSIKEQHVLDQILANIEIIPNPTDPTRNIFQVQYVWDDNVDIFEQFHRKDSNFMQVRKSTLAFRLKLLKLGRLQEFHDLIQTELKEGYLVELTDQDDIAMASLPESFNRTSLVYKSGANCSSPLRLTNDNSTMHRNGLSANDAQAVGRTSLNKAMNVLLHFFVNEVALVTDLKHCYRNFRTKLLTNVLRKIIWFKNPHDEASLAIFMPTRMTYGCLQADKVVEQACRNILARDAEDPASGYGQAGMTVAKMLRVARYLDDTENSFRTRPEKDEAVRVIREVFSHYSLKSKHYLSQKEYADNEQLQKMEELKAAGQPCTEQILGIVWNFERDSIRPALELNTHKKSRNKYGGPGLDQINIDELVITKRILARVVAQIYDCTNRILPVAIIRGKVIYSRVCKTGATWDAALQPELQSDCKKFFKELINLMKNLQDFPRALIIKNAVLKAIVGLRDGSSTGFGGLVYFVCQLPDGTRYSRVAAGKTRVSDQTMHITEGCANPLLMNLIATIVAELEECQEAKDLVIVSAGDSEAISYSYDPSHIEKQVLIRNAALESVRAAKKIISYNPSASVHFSFVNSQLNSSDWVSKEHSNIADKINDAFFREGHPCYKDAGFGVGTGDHHKEFYRIDKDGEHYTPLRPPLDNENLQTQQVLKGEDGAGEAPPPADPQAASGTYLRQLMNKFENIEQYVNALCFAEKIKLCKSFKINRENFSWNNRLIRRKVLKMIFLTSQAVFPPGRVTQTQPVLRDGLLCTTNRLNEERHTQYFGQPALPIISNQDLELIRLLLATAHVLKSAPQPGQANTHPAGVIHLSRYLTKVRMKSGFFGVHVPDLTTSVRQYVTQCTVCRKQDAGPGQTLEGDNFVVNNLQPSTGLYAVVTVDIIGSFTWTPSYNLRKKIKNKLWILVIVDNLTSAISFEFMENYSTNAYVLALRTHIQRVGRAPYICISDAGNQLKAAAKQNEEGDLDIEKAMKNFPKTQFIINPVETQHYSGKVEGNIKAAKRMIRTYFTRLKKQALPICAIFQLENLLTTIANVLNDRPIFRNSDWSISPNDLIRPFRNSDETNIPKLAEINKEKYAEFCSIFEQEMVVGDTLRATKACLTTSPELSPGDFVMMRYPSKVNGFYKYAQVQGPTPGSKHRYQVKMIGRRQKSGEGQPKIEHVDITNLILLHSPTRANSSEMNKESECKKIVKFDLVNENTSPSETAGPVNLTGLPQPVPLLRPQAIPPTAQPAPAVVPGPPAVPDPPAVPGPPQRNQAYTRRLARRAALKGGPNRTLFATPTSFHEVLLESRDLASLKPHPGVSGARGGKYISDSVIDVYGRLLEQKYSCCQYITTYTMTKLRRQPEATAISVAEACPDFFQKKVILFPVHLRGNPGHWCVLAGNLQNQKLVKYDSANYDLARLAGRISTFMFHLARALHHATIDMSIWRNIVEQDCPKQENGSDCGAFALDFMEAAVHDARPVIRQEDIPKWRVEIMKRVHRGYI